MSEQYPLLSDELSEEERFSSPFHRRLMNRDRARNHMKGAAVIITRWPEHWTTLLNYWWIGVGMIALSTYIIYNCLFSYAMLQPANKFHPKPADVKSSKLISKTPLTAPKVFMHVFVDDKQEIDLNGYLPYINIITNKYKHFDYELIIVANDTNVETENYSDKRNNDMALDMLWKNDFNYKKILTANNNFNVEYVTLTKCFYDTPMKKYWKILPHQFIKFLVRAVSIWEKGGIAFDPIVLTPQSPHSVYIEKVYNILKKFKTKKEHEKTPAKTLKQYTSSKKMNKSKLNPNNIRDVIIALENDDSTISHQEPLIEAETTDDTTVTFGRKLRSIADTSDNKADIIKPIKLSETQIADFSSGTLYHKDTLPIESTKDKQVEDPSKLNLLPLFLDFIFHNKQSSKPDQTTVNSEKEQPKNQDKSVVIANKSLLGNDLRSERMNQNAYKPVIISAKGIFEKPDNRTQLTGTVKTEVENLFEVTIDLKGNVIATDTACHAFIGNIFTNAIHHEQSESVTDFIIKELSSFCNGLLASCVGIDVILL